MIDYMKFRTAEGLVSATLAATGNKQFEMLRTLLHECEKLHKAASEVVKFFPASGDDGCWTHNPKSLEEKIKIRTRYTREFIQVVDALNKSGAA